MFEIALAVVLGILAGTFTGLTPGIHVNLITAVVVSSIATLSLSTNTAVFFIIALAITHSIIDAIPSIYLGMPDESMILAALPGHQLLHEGKGHVAILLTIIGSLAALIISFFSLPLIAKALVLAKDVATEFLVLAVLLYLLFTGGIDIAKPFLLSAMLGLVVLHIQLQQPFLALFSGLFGVSQLLLSNKGSIPKQKTKDASVSNMLIPSVLASMFGAFSAFLPGIGTSQVTILATVFAQKTKEVFLFLTGGLNTAGFFISLATLLLLDKARNGAVVGIQTLTDFDLQLFFYSLAVALIAAGCAAILATKLSYVFLAIMKKIPYQAIVYAIIFFITVLVLYFDGVLGLLILFAATMLGIYTQKRQYPKHTLMGSLVFVVLLYLF